MSRRGLIDLNKAVAAAGYAGPGDVVASALGWWGLRGYSAAYATGSNPCIDIKTSTNTNAATINILSSGSIDNSTLNTWITAHGTAYVTKIYDQSGNGFHLLTSSGGGGISIVQNNLGTQPSMLGDGGTCLHVASGITQSQPLMISYVGRRQTGGSTQTIFGSASGNQSGHSGTDLAFIYAGGSLKSATAADSSFHAVQDTFNGTSSEIYVDGSGTAANSPGTAGFSGDMGICNALGSGNVFAGYINEVGIWAGTFTAGNKSDMNSNQHTYWGF